MKFSKAKERPDRTKPRVDIAIPTFGYQNRIAIGGAGPPIVVYRFEDSRSAERLQRHMAGWRGILQCDGYAAYRRLAEPDRPGGPVTLACCWSHLRREFYKLHIAGVSQTATWTVERMVERWAVEEQIRGSDPQTRRDVRRQATKVAGTARNFVR